MMMAVLLVSGGMEDVVKGLVVNQESIVAVFCVFWVVGFGKFVGLRFGVGGGEDLARQAPLYIYVAVVVPPPLTLRVQRVQSYL